RSFLIEIHMAMRPEERMLGALWALNSYVFDNWDTAPFLGVTSPVRGCGKSRLLKLLAELVANPFYSDDVTPAVIYHDLAYGPRAFCLDEGDNFGLFNDWKMRRLLNSMHDRGGNTRRHINGRNREFPTYSQVAVGALGLLPLPLMDRFAGTI